MFVMLAASGCQDNSATAPSTLHVPDDLRAVSINDSTVELHWTRRADDDATGYVVSWNGEVRHDVGSVEVGVDSRVRISGLTGGQVYSFSVAARGGLRSDPATIRWAPATRFRDTSLGDTVLRIYESASAKGSGLVLDRLRGGPRLIVLNGSIYSGAQLALYTQTAGPDNFEIGAAYARLSTISDSAVYISTRTYNATSLDTWFLSQPLDEDILPDGNRRVFLLPTTISDGVGRGFFVRTNVAGQHHYARVLIRNVSGQLLQGTWPDRYIEIAISYQAAGDVPFAEAEQSDSTVDEGSGERP